MIIIYVPKINFNYILYKYFIYFFKKNKKKLITYNNINNKNNRIKFM